MFIFTAKRRKDSHRYRYIRSYKVDMQTIVAQDAGEANSATVSAGFRTRSNENCGPRSVSIGPILDSLTVETQNTNMSESSSSSAQR